MRITNRKRIAAAIKLLQQLNNEDDEMNLESLARLIANSIGCVDFKSVEQSVKSIETGQSHLEKILISYGV